MRNIILKKRHHTPENYFILSFFVMSVKFFTILKDTCLIPFNVIIYFEINKKKNVELFNLIIIQVQTIFLLLFLSFFLSFYKIMNIVLKKIFSFFFIWVYCIDVILCFILFAYYIERKKYHQGNVIQHSVLYIDIYKCSIFITPPYFFRNIISSDIISTQIYIHTTAVVMKLKEFWNYAY